ncbi:MAG: hypothetical protein QNI84_07850 [Henriciella sp.]|nr:hypothetical protein [Henriciella sp.]
MPLAEDPMNDAHTRIAQARFEKELTDSELNLPEGAEYLFLVGGMMVACFVSIALILLIALAPLLYFVAFAFSRKQRGAMILSTVIYACLLALFVSVLSGGIWAAGWADVPEIKRYFGDLFSFYDDGSEGMGLLATLGLVQTDSAVFMTYRQTALFLFALPLIASVIQHSDQVRAGLSRLGGILVSAFEGSHYDHVRNTAFATAHVNVDKRTASLPVTMDFGEVGYDHQPKPAHDFDADQAMGLEQFKAALKASIAAHSPNFELENVGVIAQELHSDFGPQSIDFAIRATSAVSDYKSNERERVLIECLVAALTRIERGPISSQVS